MNKSLPMILTLIYFEDIWFFHIIYYSCDFSEFISKFIWFSRCNWHTYVIVCIASIYRILNRSECEKSSPKPNTVRTLLDIFFGPSCYITTISCFILLKAWWAKCPTSHIKHTCELWILYLIKFGHMHRLTHTDTQSNTVVCCRCLYHVALGIICIFMQNYCSLRCARLLW